jgi:hypothetical protein
MTSATVALLNVTDSYSARRIAEMIAEKLLSFDRIPYRFAIKHDTRPPKCLPCPVDYDWARKDRVGIETRDRNRARGWLIRAALHDFTISECDAKRVDIGRWESIEIVRRRAAFHQRTPEEKATDDDIPF